jgi:hypothetical protein
MMRQIFVPLCGVGLAAFLFGFQPLRAQEQQPAIDPATVPLPELAFEPTERDARDYDKYFYFNRSDTDFATAYADLQECDGYARGLTYRVGGGGVPYPYGGTIGGALGGALGDALADAIHGSAERRRQRRSIMRTCMRYKGYRVFGLRKSLWEAFNFEEGNARIEESRRQRLLQMQARAASGPAPRIGEVVQ